MIVFRSALFAIGFYGWTACCALMGLPLLLGPRRLVARYGNWWSRSALFLARFIIGLNWQVRGVEHLPSGPAIIAMKHQSAWDTLAAPVIFEDPAIVVKRELTWIPLYGWYVRRAGMIAVDRAAGASALKSMMAQARRSFMQGRKIMIYPEGTRTPVGAVRPYQPGVAALYRQLDLAVVPVAVNSGLFWARRRFLKRPGRITVEILPPIAPGLDRKQFLATLQDRIESATARLLAERI